MDSIVNNNSGLTSPSRSSIIQQSTSAAIMSPASNSSKTDGIQTLLAERMAEGGGALCNDQNGLCLGYEGSIEASKSGIYTSIARIAGLLDNTVDGSSASTSSSAKKDTTNNMKKETNEVPLISIQTEQATLLVKEYGGRTIVFRVPAEVEESVDGRMDSSGDN